MGLADYLIIGLTLILYKPLNGCVLCYFGTLNVLHDEMDLYHSFPEKHLKKIDSLFLNRWIPPVTLTALSFFLWPWIHWSLTPISYLHFFIVFLSAIASWYCITLDIDLATEKTLFKERIILFCSFLGIILYPGFLILFIFTAIHLLHGWYHHQAMLFRTLQLFLTYLVAASVIQILFLFFEPSPTISSATPIFLITCMIGSHYFIPGVAKLTLGEKWLSWALENKTHYLVASSYMWGWRKDIAEKKTLDAVKKIAIFNKPFQIATLFFECGWLFAGFSFLLTLLLSIGAVLFHVFVFLTTGILFWQSLLMMGAFSSLIYFLPLETARELFTILNGTLFAAILLLFPLRKKIWKPTRLAWWDTPFIGRVQWEVMGKSGKWYRLYNDFMSPNERFFGRHLSHHLIPFPIFPAPLGEVKNKDLRDAIIASKGNLETLDQLKQKYGVIKWNEAYAKMHRNYLRTFFQNFNQGKRKSIVPSWMKPPYGQQFYFGEHVPFKGQEPIIKVALLYNEAFYNENEFKMLREVLLEEIKI